MSQLTAKASQYISGFSPSSLADLAIWYDFSDVSSLDLSGNIFQRVADKSGNNRNGYASNLTRGYFYYDRMLSGAWMSTTGFSAIDLSDISFSTPLVQGSAFFAVTPYESGTTQLFQSTTGTGGGRWMTSRGSGINQVDYQAGGHTTTMMTSQLQLVRRTHIVTALTEQSYVGDAGNNLIISNTNSKLYVNGFYQTGFYGQSNVWFQGLSNAGIRFGNNIGGTGGRLVFHEILIFSNCVNDTTRCAVEEYLRKKWYNTIPEQTAYAAPTDVSGCLVWFDVCDVPTVVFDASGYVAKWLDKTSNAYDASGIGTTNLRFPRWDASFGGIMFQNDRWLETKAPGPSNEETGFAVIDISGSTTSRNRIVHTSNLTGREISHYFGAEFQMGANGVVPLRTVGHNVSTNQKYLITWRIDPSVNGTMETMFAVDGVVERRELNPTQYFPDSPGVTTLGTRNLSVTRTYNGRMFEIALFDRRLPDADVEKMNNYFLTKWNIPKRTDVSRNFIAASVSWDWPFSNQPLFQRPLYVPYDMRGIGAWYDATDPSAFDLSGTSILLWRDKSGWQNDLSACIAGDLEFKALPTYLSNTQEVDICGGFFRLRNRGPSTNGNLCNRPSPLTFSLFMVFKPNQVSAADTSGSATSVFNMRTGTSNRFIQMPSAGYTPNFSNGFLTYTPPVTGMPTPIEIGELSTSQYNILGATCGLGKYIVTNNGTITADLSGSGGLGTSVFDLNAVTNVGRSTAAPEYFGGRLKEIIFFNRAIAESERQEVEFYLAKKWNLTSFLPSNHPGFTSRTGLVAKGYLPRVAWGSTCVFWFDAAPLLSSNYSNGETIPSLRDYSARNHPIDISGTLLYTTSYGVPGINLCNGVAIARLTTNPLATAATAFIVASLDSITPRTPNHCVTLAPLSTLSNVSRVLFMRSDTSLSIANIPSGTGAVGCNLSCNATTAGKPFIWETHWSSAQSMYVLCNFTWPGKGTGHNTLTGFSNARVFIGCDASAASTPSWRGNIHEILLYNAMMGETDRSNIRGYLAQKWKISNSLPYGAPYGLIEP